MRTSSLALVSVFVLAFTAGVLHGCGGSSGVKPTPTCVRNSECTGNLVCALGFCVQQCSSSKDCSNNQLCIKSDNGNVCRAPEVAAGCVMNSDCTKLCMSSGGDGGADSDGGASSGVCPIVCGRDRSCRTECVTDVDCPGGTLPDGSKGKQKCTTSGACIDPIIDMALYDPATNDFKTSVSGSAGTTGTAGGGAGTTGTAGGGAGAAAGSTGTAGDMGTAGAGSDAAAGATGAAGSDAGTMNPDAPEAVDMTTVTPNKSVHQGQSAVTITITKAAGGLSNPSVVSLGAIDKSKAVVQSSSTDTSLVIKVTVPHGAALGMQTLVVSTKGGVITATNVIEITAITAGPAGSDANAGSSASPFRSFGQALLVADVGDTIHLLDGTYSSATAAMGGSDEKWNTPIPNNVTIMGDTVAGTILDGAGVSGADGINSPAMLSVQNVTLKHFRYGVDVNQPNTMLTLQHVVVAASSSYGLYIDTPAIGSTVSLSGADSLIDQQAQQYGIYINGNQTSTNAKITLNITDATVQAGYVVLTMYYTSGTTVNLTNATLKDLATSGAMSITQTNNVIGNTITLKNTTVVGTISLNDKTATLTTMGGSVTQKSGSILNLSAAAAVNFSGTTFTMMDTSNAINISGANTSMTMTNCKIVGGGAGIAQQGAGSAVKLRGTEILSPTYYAYYMTGGTLDLGTAADAGMNGLGLPISPSYYSLNVASTGCTITSSSTSFGDHLDAQNNVIQGVTPSAGVVPGLATRAPQIYTIAAGSQISFF